MTLRPYRPLRVVTDTGLLAEVSAHLHDTMTRRGWVLTTLPSGTLTYRRKTGWKAMPSVYAFAPNLQGVPESEREPLTLLAWMQRKGDEFAAPAVVRTFPTARAAVAFVAQFEFSRGD